MKTFIHTYSNILASFNNCGDFNRTKPKFLEFSIKVACIVSSIMYYTKQKQYFITNGKLNKILGYDSRMHYPDSHQSIDFCTIVFESVGLGSFCDNDGYWFFDRNSLVKNTNLTTKQYDMYLKGVMEDAVINTFHVLDNSEDY